MPSTTLLDAETGGIDLYLKHGLTVLVAVTWGIRGQLFARTPQSPSVLILHTSYAPNISRLDRTRAIKGRMPNSVEMASEAEVRSFTYFSSSTGEPGQVFSGSFP